MKKLIALIASLLFLLPAAGGCAPDKPEESPGNNLPFDEPLEHAFNYRGKAEKVILVNTSDIFAGEILNHVTVPNEGLKGQFKKTFMRGDILYSEIRPANKRYAFVDFDNTENYIASTKLMVIRCRTEKVRPQFLFAILTSQSIINELQILAETRSGTFPQITFSGEVAPLPIYLPNIETQDTIVAILDSLDRKIKANQQINHNLLFSAVTLSVSNGADNIGVYRRK